MALALLVLLILDPLPALAADAVSLKLSGVRYLGDLPTLVADKLGYFDEVPAQLSVEYGRSGRDNMARLRAGEIDIATMALTPLVIDLLEGPPREAGEAPVILADLLLRSATGVYGRGQASDAVVSALEGQRVGYMPDTNAEVLWWDFTAYHGLDRESFEIVSAPVDELARGLADGELDAAVLWDPWPTLIEAERGVPLTRLGGGEEHHASWAIVARAGLVEQEPGVATAVLRAYRRAIDAIENDPAGVNALLAAHFDVAPALTAECWDPSFFDLQADWALILGVQKQLDWLEATGRGQGRSVDYRRLFALDPLWRAHPSGVSIMFRRYLDRAGKP